VTTLEQNVIEAAYDDDRQWFEDRPERHDRIRPALPDEVPAGAIAELWGDHEVGEGEGWFVRVVRGPLGVLWRNYEILPLDVPEDVPLDPIEWPS
jgi:hypothetical protein